MICDWVGWCIVQNQSFGSGQNSNNTPNKWHYFSHVTSRRNQRGGSEVGDPAAARTTYHALRGCTRLPRRLVRAHRQR